MSTERLEQLLNEPAAPVDRPAPRTWFAGTALVTLSSLATSLAIWVAIDSVAGNRYAPWILGRASGITSYLLLTALVLFGLVLSHPWRSRWRRPSTPTRIALHVALAAFTLSFLVLHIVVLATDPWAKIGWAGALLPMAAEYRPVPVTLGVIAFYSGLLTGITGLAAGRWARRVWWPIHKVAALTWVLAWLHAVLAGIDTPALWWLYVVTGLAVGALAASRYLTRTTDDELAEWAA